MSTIETERTTPPLARFARAFAVLAGVGASLGIGASALSLGPVLAEFAAENKLALPARMALLRILFAAMLGLPSLVFAAVMLRVEDPRRLATFELLARRFALLTPIGFWTLLLQERLWKGRTLLFLAANLVCTLLVWAAIRHLDDVRPWRTVSEVARYVQIRIPAKILRWAPLLLLLVALVWVVYRGMQGETVSLPRSTREISNLTLIGGLRRLGHGGVSSLPFVLLSGTWVAKVAVFSSLVLVASAAIPLFALCRPRLGTAAALVIALSYLSLPQHLLVRAGATLPLGAAAVFFFWAVYCWERGRGFGFVIAAVLMLSVHEQTATWLVCLGVYGAYRQRNRRGALWIALLGALYFSVMALVVLPRLGVDTYGVRFRTLLTVEHPGLATAVGSMLTNPAHALLRFCGQTELEFWLLLFVPLALLPLRSPHWLLWLSPFLFFGVMGMSTYPSARPHHSSVGHFVVLGLMATLGALEARKREQPGHSGIRAALFTWVFALVPAVYHLGALWLAPL